jgi:DNA-binding transcriptional ArsR family regulator
MDCYEHNDINYPLQENRIELIQKCAYSSLNRERRKILEILADEKLPITASQIGTKKGIGLEKDAIEMYLNPLYAVGLVKKQIKGNSFKWFINDESIIKFIKQVSQMMDNEKFKDDDEEEPLESVEEAISEAQKKLNAEF